MLQTISSLRAIPAVDVAQRSFVRIIGEVRCLQLSPASSVSAGPSGRTQAAGSFPVWLRPVSRDGAELARVLVQGAGSIYLGKGIGGFWLETSEAAGRDLQFDATVGDDAEDWLEPSGAASFVRRTGDIQLAGPLTIVLNGAQAVGTLTPPAGLRTGALIVAAGVGGWDNAPQIGFQFYDAAGALLSDAGQWWEFPLAVSNTTLPYAAVAWRGTGGSSGAAVTVPHMALPYAPLGAVAIRLHAVGNACTLSAGFRVRAWIESWD